MLQAATNIVYATTAQGFDGLTCSNNLQRVKNCNSLMCNYVHHAQVHDQVQIIAQYTKVHESNFLQYAILENSIYTECVGAM